MGGTKNREKNFNNRKARITGTGIFKVVHNGPKTEKFGKKHTKRIKKNLKRLIIQNRTSTDKNDKVFDNLTKTINNGDLAEPVQPKKKPKEKPKFDQTDCKVKPSTSNDVKMAMDRLANL